MPLCVGAPAEVFGAALEFSSLPLLSGTGGARPTGCGGGVAAPPLLVGGGGGAFVVLVGDECAASAFTARVTVGSISDPARISSGLLCLVDAAEALR